MLDDDNFPHAPDNADKGGRPTVYTSELAELIFDEVTLRVSLGKIGNDPKYSHFPTERTIYRWLKKIPEFCQGYDMAKQWSADKVMDELIDIADDDSNDLIERFDKDGNSIGMVPNSANVARAKIKIDTRFKLAAKLKPKKYGEAQLIEIQDTTERPETLPTMKQSVMNMLAKKRGQKTQQ